MSGTDLDPKPAQSAIPEVFSSREEYQRCVAISTSYLLAIQLDLAPEEPSFVAPYLATKALP